MFKQWKRLNLKVSNSKSKICMFYVDKTFDCKAIFVLLLIHFQDLDLAFSGDVCHVIKIEPATRR